MIKYKSTERVRIMKLPSYVRKALEKLESKGYEAYVVGGAVRDSLLNKKPNDYDVSTNALPEEVKEVFAGYPVFDTGIKHGTVSVIIGRDKPSLWKSRPTGARRITRTSGIQKR